MNVREEIITIASCPPGWHVLWNDLEGKGEPIPKPIAALALVRIIYPGWANKSQSHMIVPVVAWEDTGFEVALSDEYGGIISPDGQPGKLDLASFGRLGDMDTPL